MWGCFFNRLLFHVSLLAACSPFLSFPPLWDSQNVIAFSYDVDRVKDEFVQLKGRNTTLLVDECMRKKIISSETRGSTNGMNVVVA